MNEINRKQFLQLFWTKIIRPFLLVLAIILIIVFIVNVFKENGTSRFTVVLISIVAIFYFISKLVGNAIRNILEAFCNRLSADLKFWLRIGGRLLAFVSPIIFGIVIYQIWMEDWIFASIICSIVLIEQFSEIMHQEKS